MRFLFALMMLALIAVPAKAETAEDTSKLFCKDMQDEALYDKNKFDAYKMLVPGKEGWIFRTSTDLKTDFSLTPEGLQNLRALNGALKARGISLVMLFTPTRGLVHDEYLTPDIRKKYGFSADAAWKNYHAAVNAMRAEGLSVVSLDRMPQGAPFFYKRDHHWNASGSRIAADAVAAHIKTLPAYAAVEKTSFIPKEGDASDFHGVSKKVFKTLCDTEQPPERIVQKYTERAEATADQNALFGDAAPAQIVLLGTSNSTQEPSYANFAGFLKEALSAEILNMSVSGGGLDTAMLAYLGSDDYRKTPAKIAIWEVPSYYAISNHENFFREAIPATFGACGPDTTVAEAKDVSLSEKTTFALTKLADKDIYGDRYYLYLGFEKTVSKPFTASFLYHKDREKFRFAHSNRYPQDREFFLKLDKKATTPLDKVVLTVPQEMIGNTVTAKICRQPDSSAAATIFQKIKM